MHIPARVDEESGSPIHTRRDVVAQELQVVFATRLARAWYDNDQWENVSAERTDAGSKAMAAFRAMLKSGCSRSTAPCHYPQGPSLP